MKKPKGTDYSESYSSRWDAAVQKSDYTEALECAIKGYQTARDLGDEAHRMAFLGLIRFAVRELVDQLVDPADKEASQGLRCSFCGREKGEVELVAGAGATICQICVETIHKQLTESK
jgi:formylmethanofuran dehydrogenase subunit E